ncbi:hypothetical protein RN001_013128 [Aquatica leii]|uniref:Uncharacterized protein n=1 Tax=Aquatica leii TaxID=1421715 RepID=A0AAN7QCW0_9COLE|nr:hypothetical protein RN001_013128 [Aquatica leii]
MEDNTNGTSLLSQSDGHSGTGTGRGSQVGLPGSISGDHEDTAIKFKTSESEVENPPEELHRQREQSQTPKAKVTRKLSIVTSPLQQENTPRNMGLLDLTWDEEEGRSVKKRRRNETEETPARQDDVSLPLKLAARFRKTLKEMDKEIGILSQYVRENTNTKKEIKSCARSLKSLNSALNTDEMKELLQSLGRAHRDAEQENLEQKLLEEITERKHREAELIEKNYKLTKLQRELEEEANSIKKDMENLERLLNKNQISAVTRSNIKQTKNFDDYIRLLKKEWSSDIYTNTRIEVNNPVRMNTEADLAVWVYDNDLQMEQGIQKEFNEKYPELQEIEEDYGYITVKTKVKKRDRVIKKERYITKMKGDDTEETHFEALRNLMEQQQQLNRNNVVLHQPCRGTTERFRKMVECVATQFVIQAIICIPNTYEKKVEYF